ncbi:glycosyltransferase [bacterium]|nr:glycosyltransferase [bacterium]
MPKFSIITINFNNNEGLEKTIASVIAQKYQDYEFIVVDAKSSDGSVETIKENASAITKWVTEKDSGRYNGMNKGIKMSSGEYLIFLNSGDIFCSDYVLLEVSNHVLTELVYFGNLIVKGADNALWVVDFGKQVLNMEFFQKYALPHQAMFYHRNVFQMYGAYDESYMVTGDQDFNLRLFKNNISFKHIPVAVAIYNIGGISSNPKYERIIREEKGEMFDTNLGYPPVHFFTIVLNGLPYLKYHINVFKKLPFPWHWHIIEGVADLTGDTAWSLTTGATIPEKIHKDGRSKDGTSEYIDELLEKYPDNITVYRKPLGQVWNGKVEMVNAPLVNIQEETLLWEVDCDEFWTYEQIITMRNMFKLYPEKLAAHFLAYIFVGKDIVLADNIGKYGNNPEQEWYRVWRVFPGTKWIAHEPPKLIRPGEDQESPDFEKDRTFTHVETAAAGLIFQHFAYGIAKQLHFKEFYYGYKDATKQWELLQKVEKFPVYFREYCQWVTDTTTVRKASDFGIIPLMKTFEDGKYGFVYDPVPIPKIAENMTFRLVQQLIDRVKMVSRNSAALENSDYSIIEQKLFKRIHRMLRKLLPPNSKIETVVKKVIKIVLKMK